MKKKNCDLCHVEVSLEVLNDQKAEDRLWRRMWAGAVDTVTGEAMTICAGCKQELSQSGRGGKEGFVLQ